MADLNMDTHMSTVGVQIWTSVAEKQTGKGCELKGCLDVWMFFSCTLCGRWFALALSMRRSEARCKTATRSLVKWMLQARFLVFTQQSVSEISKLDGRAHNSQGTIRAKAGAKFKIHLFAFLLRKLKSVSCLYAIYKATTRKRLA